MLDLVRRVLAPAGVAPARRTTELTVAMLQLVASGRGVAALPLWAVKSYLDRGYVASQRIGAHGLDGPALCRGARAAARAAVRGGVRAADARDVAATLPGVTLL